MEIREEKLTGEVLEKLIGLSKDWEAEDSTYGYRANTAEDIEGNRIFLALDGEKVIGYLFGHVERSKNMTSIMTEGTPFFEAEELYVVPSRRSEGIGKSLFEFSEEAVKDTAGFIVLSTATKNCRRVLHFYLDELGMTFWSARLFKKI